MSDYSQVIIRLDAPGDDEREVIAASIREWLLGAQVIMPFTPNPTWQESFGRNDFSPGPRWRDAVDEQPGRPFESLWHHGVDIRSNVDYRSALGTYEPWSCSRCGAESEHEELVSQWVETFVEPTARCESCGWEALLGDWPCEFPAVLVGAPIVVFHNWHPLSADFLQDLGRRMEGRRIRSFWSRL